MKKLLIGLFCFFTAFVFSQTFHFDYFIKENSKRIKPDPNIFDSQLFYDSKSQQDLSIRINGEKILGIIYLRKEGVRHVFKVNQTKDNMTFTYKHSTKFDVSQSKNYSKDDFINIVKIDSLNFQIDVFINSKRKKKRLEFELKLEEGDFDYLKIHADYNRTDDIEEKIKSFLDPQKSFVISKMITKYSSGYVFQTTLPKFQKTDLTLIVPEKLIIKEFDYGKEFED